MTLKTEYLGKPEKGCGRDLGAKIFFKRAENNIYCIFSKFFPHITMSQNDDSKFDIKFSSHGHNKTYWVSVPSFLYTQECVRT